MSMLFPPKKKSTTVEMEKLLVFSTLTKDANNNKALFSNKSTIYELEGVLTIIYTLQNRSKRNRPKLNFWVEICT